MLVTDLDPTIIVALLALAGVVLTTLGGVVGALIVRGTEIRRIIAGAPAGYAQLVEDLQQERDGLNARLDRQDLEMASMRTRIRGLETGQDTDRHLIDVLREHVIELRTALRRAGITPPPIPPGSGIEDSGDHAGVTTS